MSHSFNLRSSGKNVGFFSWQQLWLMVGVILLGISLATLPLPLVGALVTGFGFLILMLIQPLAGVALVLMTGPLGAVESIYLGTSLLKSGQLIFILTFGAWLGYGVLRHRINLPRTSLNLPLIFFIGVAAFSLIDNSSLWIGIKELIKWFGLGAAMLLVTDLGTSWNPLETKTWLSSGRRRPGINPRWLVAMLLVAGLSQALLGIWQFGIRGDGPDHFMILDRFFRAFGTFQQPNPFGGYMGLTAILAIGAALGMVMSLFGRNNARQSWQLKEWIWLLFLLACASILGVALLMSWSRGAWIGFAAGMAMLALFLPRRRWVGLLFVGAGILILVFLLSFNLLPASIIDRLISFVTELGVGDVRRANVTLENFSVIERLAHWQAGLDMARENLWFGVGFGNYEPAYSDFGLLNWPHALGHAHNYYLNILAEAGILGALAYLVLWLSIFGQSIRLLRRLTWPNRGIALGLLAAWTALSVHHLFDKLYVNNLYLFLGVMLGLQQVLAVQNDRADS